MELATLVSVAFPNKNPNVKDEKPGVFGDEKRYVPKHMFFWNESLDLKSPRHLGL